MNCDVCFHHCDLQEGEVGFCNARGRKNGKIISLTYGKVTSLALDPIEKKPLRQFHPGTKILSVGSYGCNLHCPFCQNYKISRYEPPYSNIRPKDLVDLALQLSQQGNIGIAFTYNEPLVGLEYIKDCAKLAHNFGLKTVVVSNGTITKEKMMELLPYIDAINIDLKAFQPAGYQKLCGNLETVKQSILLCAAYTHVEITTLVVPGLNDQEQEFREEVAWIASISKDIPLHITRYFPRYQSRVEATPISLIEYFCEIAREQLTYVYPGNC